MKKLKLFIFGTFIALFLGFLFWNLDGGVVLGEPDEVTHWEVMENFKQGDFWPKYSGGPWYYELPGLPFFGYLFSFFVPGKYTPLRVFSAVSYLSLAAGIFWWGKNRRSLAFGLFSALAWLLSPLAIFYARLGVLDAGSVSFSTLSFLFLDEAVRKKNSRLALASGLFLSIGLYIKYSVLIFVGAFGLFFLYRAFLQNKDRFFKEKSFKVSRYSFLSFLIAFLLTAPVFLILLKHDSWIFRHHLKINLGLFIDEIREASSVVTLWSYGTDVFWWLSWPLVLLSLFGLVILLTKIKKAHFFNDSSILYGLTIFAVLAALIRQRPFYPRYILMLVPFLAVLAAFALEWAYKKVAESVNSKLALVSFLALGMLYFANFTLLGWQSSQNELIPKTVAYIKKQTPESSPWVFSNYWPHYFKEATTDGKYAWLSTDIRDAAVYIPEPERNTLETFYQDGGFVLLEETYATNRAMIIAEGKSTAWEQVARQEEPAKIIVTDSPNFPYFRKSGNRVVIYRK